MRRAVQAMATRGRSPGFVMSHEHRVKIQNSNILNALIEHVLGTREMSSTQVTAGLGLMKKVLPDLQSMTVGGDEDGAPIRFEDAGAAAAKLRAAVDNVAERLGTAGGAAAG